MAEYQEFLAGDTLALEPVVSAARAIGLVAAFGYDGFQAEPAGMFEHGRPIGIEVLAEPYRRAGGQLGQHLLEHAFAVDQRRRREIVAVAVDEIESVIAHAILPAGAQVRLQTVEGREPVRL